jgi:hypothetical protein
VQALVHILSGINIILDTQLTKSLPRNWNIFRYNKFYILGRIPSFSFFWFMQKLVYFPYFVK